MAEAGQIIYSLNELTALMLRDQRIRSGLWMIWAKFNFGVTNILRETEGIAGPGVVSQLVEIGLQEASGPGPLVVDAATVWKGPKANRKRRRTSNAQ